MQETTKLGPQSVLLAKCHLGHQTKNLRGRTAHEGRQKFVQNLGRKNLKERNHLKNQDIDGKIILKFTLRKQIYGV